MGVVPKHGTAKFRLTVNMRYVNRHFGTKVFKLKGLKDRAYLAEKGDHAVTYDLMSGYYHVYMHPSSKTFVKFRWEGEYYVYNCLSSRLLKAPWVFSKVMRKLAIFRRRDGIKLLPYLYDFVFIKRGFQQSARMARRMEGDFVRAGLRINGPK